MNFIKALIGFYFNFLAILFPKVAGKQSFYFFCIPFKAPLKESQQKFLQTAQQQTLKVEGKNIQTYAWGEGDNLILFTHGWQSNAFRWKNYIEKIDLEKSRVVAFDAPGHGNSAGLISNVPLFEKSIKAVTEFYGNPNSIVSHSIGAFASMFFLHKNNIHIDKFVSLATASSAAQFVEVFKSELNVSDKLINQMRNYFQVYTDHPIEYFAADNFAQSIKADTLLIHDEEDKTCPVETSKGLYEIIDNSELHISKGYGHRLKTDEIVNRVCDFIAVKTINQPAISSQTETH